MMGGTAVKSKESQRREAAPATEPDAEDATAIEKTRAEAKAALSRARAEERGRRKAETALAEAQEALSSARTEIERERNAREAAERTLTSLRETLASTEAALHQQQSRIAAGYAGGDPPSLASAQPDAGMVETSGHAAVAHSGAKQRASFIVRLTLDEHSQPQRSEIEHVQSGSKKSFSSLDTQLLTDFMRDCIIVRGVEQAPAGPAHSPEERPAAPPMIGQTIAATILPDVQVSRQETPGMTALVLPGDSAFVVRVSFRLQGVDLSALAGTPYTTEVYAHGVTSHTSVCVASATAELVEDRPDYTSLLRADGLPSGIYRLATLITFPKPLRMAGYHNGPVIQVSAASATSIPEVSPPAGASV
jgi:hypothetical protein